MICDDLLVRVPSISSYLFFYYYYYYLVPRLDGAGRSGNSGYHGLVDEDKLIVDVTPKIRAVGAEICAFRIVNKHHGETPFEVSLASVHLTKYSYRHLPLVLYIYLPYHLAS